MSRNDNVDYLGRPRVQTMNTEDSMTVESDRNLTDIREILRNAGMTDFRDHLQQVDDMFLDVTEFTDLQDALNQAKLAEGQFMELPPQIRSLFGNDVARWLDTAHDQEKIDELLIDPKARAVLTDHGYVDLPETPPETPAEETSTSTVDVGGAE